MTDVPHTYFVDKSGPGSLITDADLGKFCVAYLAGECRPGAVAGDVFFAGIGFYDAGQCVSNDSTLRKSMRVWFVAWRRMGRAGTPTA